MTEPAGAGGGPHTWQLDRATADPDLQADLAAGWTSRAEAEAWLSGMYAALADDGVDEVTLLADGQAVYTMSLHL